MGDHPDPSSLQTMNEPKLRALIVDDRVDARNHLKQLLQRHLDIGVIGEAERIPDAVALCNDLHPNLIFLDIELRGETGFSLLEKLDPLPAIIFVTGYSEYAVRAFEVNAVDYLLKPVSPSRLSDALQRIIHAPPSTQSKPFLPNDRIFLRHEKKVRVVFIPDISGIKAEENYTDVYLSDGSKIFMRQMISEWEECLPAPMFFSPHRSLIVNLNAIHDIVLESRDRISFKLLGHEKVFSIGQRPAADLRQAMRLSQSR